MLANFLNIQSSLNYGILGIFSFLIFLIIKRIKKERTFELYYYILSHIKKIFQK